MTKIYPINVELTGCELEAFSKYLFDQNCQLQYGISLRGNKNVELIGAMTKLMNSVSNHLVASKVDGRAVPK